MPRQVCNQPKGLKDICADYAAVNIDGILKYEEQMELSSVAKNQMTLQRMPVSLYRLILDKILDVGSLNDDNYRNILNDKTTNFCFKYSKRFLTVNAEFSEFIQEQCKNIVQIELRCLPALAYEIFSKLAHLEFIGLGDCEIKDDCLELIAANCRKLKHLNIENNWTITDDGIRALSNCSELTHLYLRCDPHKRQNKFDPAILSTIVQRCPNLEILDHACSGIALWKALDAYLIPIAVNREAQGSGQSALKGLESVTGLQESLEPKVFKIKEIQMACDREDLGVFFQAVGVHCPFLEKVTLEIPQALPSGCFDGILHLQLRSVAVKGTDPTERLMNVEVLMLLRSVGHSLTHLKLVRQSLFDLRVIKRECPNLINLHLISSYSSSRLNIWANYPIDELTSACFESLTHLKLDRHSSTSDENLISLLASPKLESVYSDIDDGKCVAEAIRRFPDAFSSLKSAIFICDGVMRDTWSAFLDRAVVLEQLTASLSFYVLDVEDAIKDEKYFNRLICYKNWALDI